MKPIQGQEREGILLKLQSMQHPGAGRTCCLGCKGARLQINNRNKYELDEYASPAIVKEHLQKLDVTIVCVAASQQIKIGQISVCELFDGF